MIIALDIGTSSTRATLYDAAGCLIEGVQHQVLCEPLTVAGGGVEHDPMRLLEAAVASIDAVLHRAGEVRGALSHSRVWAQMIADALGQPLTLSSESEASSRGIALLALGSLGIPPGLAGARAPDGERVEPDPARRERYAEAAARHGRLYDALAGPSRA